MSVHHTTIGEILDTDIPLQFTPVGTTTSHTPMDSVAGATIASITVTTDHTTPECMEGIATIQDITIRPVGRDITPSQSGQFIPHTPDTADITGKAR